ncbi:MAG: glutathione-disulfide reductase [Xanthomonadales bacterium]|nr:glutathione-disulfide reductase [Xanthomonadales bacterium]
MSETTQYDFDLFVIGAGSGGVRAARIAAGYGARVGICEESRVGGTCVIRGCVPKKLMVYAAHFAEDFEDARGYGWEVGESRFSWPRLIAAKDAEIDRLNQVYLRLLADAGVTLYQQRGTLAGPHEVQLGSETVSAEHILVATGGRPWVPEIPGAEHAITSDEVFHLDELPARVAIVGGGFIACEFAGIFNGLGSRVTQLYRGDAVLRGFDGDVRRVVGEELRNKGVDLRLESDVERIVKTDDGLRVDLQDGECVVVDEVLYATGRVPNVRGLGLPEVGVEVRADGRVVVDELSCTSVGHIYAVGDVTSRVNLTPVAIYEGHAFADTVFGGRTRPVNHEFVPSAVFSQPPVGTVGYSEEDAIHHVGAVDIFLSEFRPMKHTLSGRNEKMMMKLVVDRESQGVVGVHIVGPDAPEIVQGFAVAVKSGLTKDRFDCTIGIHPTAAEELVTMRTPVRSHG